MKKSDYTKTSFAINFGYCLNQIFSRLYVLLFLSEIEFIWIKLYHLNKYCNFKLWHYLILYIKNIYIRETLGYCMWIYTSTCLDMYLRMLRRVCNLTAKRSSRFSSRSDTQKVSRELCPLTRTTLQIPRDAPDCLDSPDFAPSERNWHTANEARCVICEIKYIANSRLFKKMQLTYILLYMLITEIAAINRVHHRYVKFANTRE